MHQVQYEMKNLKSFTIIQTSFILNNKSFTDFLSEYFEDHDFGMQLSNSRKLLLDVSSLYKVQFRLMELMLYNLY